MKINIIIEPGEVVKLDGESYILTKSDCEDKLWLMNLETGEMRYESIAQVIPHEARISILARVCS